MPFDGTEFKVQDDVLEALEDIQKKITPQNWCKGFTRAGHRKCLLGWIIYSSECRADLHTHLQSTISDNSNFCYITSFNDHPSTRFIDVKLMLDKAIVRRRQEVLNGN